MMMYIHLIPRMEQVSKIVLASGIDEREWYFINPYLWMLTTIPFVIQIVAMRDVACMIVSRALVTFFKYMRSREFRWTVAIVGGADGCASIRRQWSSVYAAGSLASGQGQM